MILKSILAGSFKLDGGAMFGVVPKKIWSKLIPSDEYNLCSWALRCLYIEHGNKKILIDTGMGNKQDEKFFNNYQTDGHINIVQALAAHTIHPDSITDVLLTHLHFDHCGGAVLHDENKNSIICFKNATYWVHESQWNLANNPNAREKASFLKENLLLLKNKIQFINHNAEYFGIIQFIKVSGHTEGMLLPLIKIEKNKSLLFAADLFPSVHHIPLPYIMAYDMQPLVTLVEKESVLEKMIAENIALFFEHDYNHEIAIVGKANTGKYYIEKILTLESYLSY